MPRNIPEADPDEPLETKPFKFVTGEFLLPLLRVNWHAQWPSVGLNG